MLRFLIGICLFLLPLFMVSQHRQISGKVLNANTQKPLPYANVYTQHSLTPSLTNVDGTFTLKVADTVSEIIISYLGFQNKTLSIKGKSELLVGLTPKREALQDIVISPTRKLAEEIIAKVIARKPQNNSREKFDTYSYKNYSKTIIDDEDSVLNVQVDTTNREVQTIFNQGRSYLSEQVSVYEFNQKKGLKKTIKATRTAGFESPVYELLSLKIQSESWYEKDYTVFGTDYAGPLTKSSFRNYRYKILDTTQTKRPAYLVYFQPKRQKAVAGLEGVLYIDTLNFGLQKAVGQLVGEVDIKAQQDFKYFPEEDIWFPVKNTLTLKPGTSGKKVSIFGGNISLGSLPERKNAAQNLFLQSVSTNQNIQFNPELDIPKNKSAVSIVPNAAKKSADYWQENRSLPFTARDRATFKKVDSIIKKENIARKIDIIQNFNIGYFPIGFFDVDLRTLIKVNNYEGLRLGFGGKTNAKLSEKFRLQGYGVYGFKDAEIKYSLGGGIRLNEEKNTWLNLNYTDDVNEVGSYFYLTDARVYSLFEPRLVNINFYYKYKKWRASLQHRFTPNLLSEWELSKSDITQTGSYRYEHEGKFYKDYTLTEATASLRWSPFSTYLKAPDKTIELEVGYPKISFQATQAFSNILGGDYNFTKLGAKINYTINRITQNNTEFILEGDYVTGDVPLTHSFHAFPNNPNKETILNRFSVAGRRTFETMFFSEFFSDRLASLQVKHFFREFDFGKYSKPQIVLITRHAIGNMRNIDKHYGLNFNTLDHGYSESGFEINKILYGFGLSFAYRYGAYHLPKFEDNISFKFTFYFKL